MPITSTKNLKLSSGFGVSSSRWPRWARSRIGSGCMSMTLFNQRTRHIIEQLVDGKLPGNETLLRRVRGNASERTPHVGGRKTGFVDGGRRDQQPMDLAHDRRVTLGQFPADDHHVVD